MKMNIKQRVSKILDNGDSQYLFTEGDKPKSVMTSFYSVMKAKGITRILTMRNDRIEISNEAKPSSIDLSFLRSLPHTLIIPDNMRVNTIQTYIYSQAESLGLAVTVKLDGRTITVIEREANKPTFMGQLRKLVDDMPYGSELKLPATLIDSKPLASVRTTLNKLPYELSFRKGFVTKHRYRMRKQGEMFTVSDGINIVAKGEDLSVLVDALICRGVLTHEVEGL